MSVNYDYKVNLIGILPQGYAFGVEPNRWDVGDLKVIRTPSEQIGITGLIEKNGHRNLHGTAIIEKISQMRPKPARRNNYSKRRQGLSSCEEESGEEGNQTESSWATDSATSDTDSDNTEEESDDSDNSSKSSLVSSVCSSNKSVTSNFKLTMLNDWNRGSLRLRWLKNNFLSKMDEVPQIICNRRFLCQFMTSKDRFFTVKAKKSCFSARAEANQGKYVVIEISGGYSFHHLKDPHESKKERRDYFQPADAPEDRCNAFYSAVLSRRGSGGVSSQKINILLDTSFDGVWKKRKDPMNYESQDIAEVRHVEASTIYPPPWKGFLHHYKQTVLAGHWAQSTLIGASKYMVNVYGDKNDSDLIIDKKVKEKWLYDVDSLPSTVRDAARTDGFRAWDKKDMLGHLYNSLQYIRNYMARPGMPEEETTYFVHYENEDHLLPLNTEDMDDELNCLREAKKTIVIKNISFDSPDLLIAEENAKSLIDSLMSQETGTDRWPKPQLLMFPEQQMLHLKFKYLQHSTTFMRIAKKFVRSNTSPAMRSIRISRHITERLQNLLNVTAGYDDGSCGDHRFPEPTGVSYSRWRFAQPSAPTNNMDSGAFIFPSIIANATTDQNWRTALNIPYGAK